MIPACERIYCPDIRELLPDTRLRLEPGNYEAGASYKFSCPVNYELIGPRYEVIFMRGQSSNTSLHVSSSAQLTAWPGVSGH